MTLHDLPVHPLTGLTAIGLRKDGRPIWPVLGASDDDDVIVADTPVDDDVADTAEGADDTDVDGDDEPLGPKGEKALRAEKQKRRDADKARREAIRERDEFAARIAELEKLTAGRGDDEEIDFDAIRKEAAESGKAEAQAEVLVERVLDKIQLLASKRFHDTEDAAAYLHRQHDIEDFLDDKGKIDAEAIEDALSALLEKKPHWAAAAAQGGAKRFQGSGDGGARKGPKGPSQLTDQDLKRMTPEQIVEAHEAGRFKDLLG
jgi:hypothetical protein